MTSLVQRGRRAPSPRPLHLRALAILAFAAASAFLAVFACLAGPARAADVPYLTGRVVDNAEILSAQARAAIEAASRAHEDATGDQVVVLTVRTLDGESIEQYAQDVFGAWKLGQKGRDNGILVLVAPAERRMRIEVGYGLEGTLPDVLASRIIRDVMTPAFKANDFDAGVKQGVDAIIGQLEGRGEAYLPKTVEERKGAAPHMISINGGPPQEMSWTMRILLGLFIFSIIGIFTVVGVLTPGIGWFLYFFLIPFWAMFPMVVVGERGALWIVGTYLVGFPVAKLWARAQPWYAKAAADLKKNGKADVGGWVITSGGSSSGGSSSGGGGFSGGGGSSGGGGASGSW